MSHWRLTVAGGEELERELRRRLELVKRTVEETIPRSLLVCLALMGGYGRGEGGVEVQNGRECPHNNLDFLVVIQSSSEGEWRERLARELRRLDSESEVALDLSVVSAARLRRARSKILWYDLFHGHRTLLGDAAFIPSLGQFTLEAVPHRDVLDLMVNRGTLLIINRLLCDQERLSTQQRKLIIRHTMKALIGYGDALLYRQGLYHWSYAEKSRRMQGARVSERFRALYQEAIAFRFRADYPAHSKVAERGYQSSLSELLEPMHLEFEMRRLGCGLEDWSAYPREFAWNCLCDGGFWPRELARKLLALRRTAGTDLLPGVSGLALRCGGHRAITALLYPLVAFSLSHSGFEKLGCRFGPEQNWNRLYLQQWGKSNDSNFAAQAARFGIEV